MTSWTESCIVAVGDKLAIDFVGNACPRCTLETLVWSEPRPRRAANREPALAPSAATFVAKAGGLLACSGALQVAASGAPRTGCLLARLHRHAVTSRLPRQRNSQSPS
jgi:hypothetical protein